ncbi:MAG: DNA methyltransferase [Candidatus Acidiferrales bacterium]
MNQLYYGDNLDVLRRYIKDESVDLVYLDPPFKSNQDYNVLFAEKDGTGAAAQFKAFEDTWEWNQLSQAVLEEIIEGGGRVSQVMQAFRQFLGTNDMLAYLTMMAPRLVELHRVLKSTGSIYLHCDDVASHYLKLLLDAIFGPGNFQNQIVWKRTTAHSDPGRYGRNIDTILFYSKELTGKIWNSIYRPHDEKYLARFRNSDSDGRKWMDDNLTAKGLTGGGYDYEYKGARSLWRVPLKSMEELDRDGRLHFTNKGGIRLKRYLDENKGLVAQTLWDDIFPINSQAKERLGYPTQKPEALLERIVESSSHEGDTVLDPFCGCGTTIAVAQRLNRNWIGIDITHLAIGLIKSRLHDAFPDVPAKEMYEVTGEPVAVEDAQELAKEDPYQFQWWALGLVGARRTEQKKGSDQGIDGRLYFHDEGEGGATKQIILSVKSGHVNVTHIRDLRGVIEREKAEIGVLLTFEDATKPMRTEAAAAGIYKSPWGKRGSEELHYPRLQILTIAELLEGKGIDYPHMSNVTFKRAPRAETPQPEQLTLNAAPETTKPRKPRQPRK